MRYKTILKTVALSMGAISALECTAQKQTNFIIILMDDMGYGDINSNGAIGYEMPNVQRMINNGMKFTRYYSPQAVSGASRAGLLTGCYPNRIGISGAPGPNAVTGIHEDEKTIAEVLKPNGYKCAAFGKWHLGHLPQFLPTNNGFDEFYGIPYSNDMWPNHPQYKYPDLPLIEGTETIELNADQTQFTTDFTDRAVEFIDKNKRKPFFLYLAHPMPHVPLFVSDKFKGKSEQGLYGDVMMEIDWSIGQILDKLQKERLDDNTLVIITSDNGPWINYGNHAGSTGGLREAKGTSFEGGQRVPCVMQWVGTIPKGTVCNKLSTSLDLISTFAAIADAQLPDHKIDGVNLLPLLLGDNNANPRENFYYYYNRNSLEAVTDGEFKLIFPHHHRSYVGYLPGNDGAPGNVTNNYFQKEKLLFDLRRDPGERENVISQHPKELYKLEKLATQARKDLGDDLTRSKGENVREIGRVK